MLKFSAPEKERAARAANALADLRIENLHPSQALTAQLLDFVKGTITTAEMLEDVKRRYVTLRNV